MMIAGTLDRKDSSTSEQAIRALDQGKTSNHYYNGRVLVLKANQMDRFRHGNWVDSIKYDYDLALNEAYRTGEPPFISQICEACGSSMAAIQEIELAATYYLKAEEINEDPANKIRNPCSACIPLGEILYHTREYEKSIYYIRKGLEYLRDTTASNYYYRIRYFNTIGQAYQQLGKLDSTIVYYRRSMAEAQKSRDSTWIGINFGYIGQYFFLKKDYASAKPLLEKGYQISKRFETNIAAYLLHWLARIDLIEGRKDSALIKLKESIGSLERSGLFPFQQRNFLQSIYYLMADAYRAIGKTDSFYHYFGLYSALHDSLERVAAFSSMKISQLRIDNEKNYFAVREISQKEEAAVMTRNLIMAGIILIAVIVLLMLNRSRANLAMKEKMATADVAAAKDQLQLFTQNILEKASLIERLQLQLRDKELTTEQQQLIQDLSNHTILNDEDWNRFRVLFEKIYPGFFARLRATAADITLAEQRMAALTKLQLTTKQMASMLGISPNSVNKTRQRIRQRFHLPTEAKVEEFILNL